MCHAFCKDCYRRTGYDFAGMNDAAIPETGFQCGTVLALDDFDLTTGAG